MMIEDYLPFGLIAISPYKVKGKDWIATLLTLLG
jgi:hypothetical protein